MDSMTDPGTDHPPSVDALARVLSGLPHALLVESARSAIADGDPSSAEERVMALCKSLHQPVINGTGVLLHTNLGRAPVGISQVAGARNIEFDLLTGRRGSRQRAVGGLIARLCGSEAAMVVNNNAAALLLVIAALAGKRQVAVSRGESVEIGGGFRIPEIIAQSGADMVDVGTTNRTHISDYTAALDRCDKIAMVLKVHSSNYQVTGFVCSVTVKELSSLSVPVIVDIGSGLLDSTCPWLKFAPAWLAGEPAARQTLADGAALVTFSADKLFGGPQAGIIVGRADLISQCERHPLARALRPGGLILAALQQVALTYLDRDGLAIPFWRLATAPVETLQSRAVTIARSIGRDVDVEPTLALPGAGSSPSATIPSFGLVLEGDRRPSFLSAIPPLIARARRRHTIVDLRSVDEADDPVVARAIEKSF